MRIVVQRRLRARVVAGSVAAVLSFAPAAAHAVTLFFEDFNGYTSFPAFDPVGDPVNPGLPTIAAGADEHWYGIRFANPSTGGSIAADIAVQSFGSSSNPTPVGRREHSGIRDERPVRRSPHALRLVELDAASAGPGQHLPACELCAAGQRGVGLGRLLARQR
ncbi:MAG: hypothetical protein WEF50_15640 [Myxococcota bacterium]